MIILAYYDTPSQEYAREMVDYLDEYNLNRRMAREVIEFEERELGGSKGYLNPERLRRELIKKLRRYFIIHASEIRKIGLKEGEGIEKLRKLRKNGEGVIQIFNAEYKWIPPFWDSAYTDGEEWVEETYIITGYPETNEELGEMLSDLALRNDDRIHVRDEHPSKHVGEDSLRITVFPEIRTEDGKILMKREETQNLLEAVFLDFDNYLWKKYDI